MENIETVNQQQRAHEPAIPPEWTLPSDELTLADDEVHVWRAALDLPEAVVHDLRRTLDAAEIVRAERFHFHKDRDHFIVARGLLRTILGRYLKADPCTLGFRYGTQGKPYLIRPQHQSDEDDALQFNLSHSAGVVLLAVTSNRELGIDLERIRPEFASESIAEQYFSPPEIATLRSLPVTVQPAAFFNCWTRKEAYLKARADGLSFPLDQFDVSLIPGEPPVLFRVRSEPCEIERWSLHQLNPGSEYAATLVIEGHSCRLETLRWLP